MLTIYKTTDKGLEKLDDVVPNCWVDLTDPTTDEMERIKAEGVPHDFLIYPLDIDERSRTEREDDGTLLVVLRIPYYAGPKEDVPYRTMPLGIILTSQFIVTISRYPNEITQEFARGRVRGLATAKRYRFVLRLLLAVASKYLQYLREINHLVDEVEDRLQASMRNKEVQDLLMYQKSLVYFATALKSNELMMERLQRGGLFSKYEEDEDLLEDVITENQQAIEMVNISSSILSGMMDAFASIISNNLNVVMKFLASMTIVLSIPAIITSFFGMNVELPMAENPLAYLFIIGISIAIAMLVVVIFIRRNWF
jgi:magnesium transporter